MKTMTFVVVALVGAAAGAQEATEIFIPLGQSPALSKTATVIGHIETVDAASSTIVVTVEGRRATVTITEKTKIFLDRSQRKEPNGYGTFKNLEKGARVEVLYEGRTRAAGGPAEWIKVEVAR